MTSREVRGDQLSRRGRCLLYHGKGETYHDERVFYPDPITVIGSLIVGCEIHNLLSPALLQSL